METNEFTFIPTTIELQGSSGSYQPELLACDTSYGPADSYDTNEDPYNPTCVYGIR